MCNNGEYIPWFLITFKFSYKYCTSNILIFIYISRKPIEIVLFKILINSHFHTWNPVTIFTGECIFSRYISGQAPLHYLLVRMDFSPCQVWQSDLLMIPTCQQQTPASLAFTSLCTAVVQCSAISSYLPLRLKTLALFEPPVALCELDWQSILLTTLASGVCGPTLHKSWLCVLA